MLLLLLSFYVHYDLLNCEEIVKAKFNESLLVNHHRQILVQVNSLLQDLEERTRKITGSNVDDYENNIRREKLMYENIPSALRSGMSPIFRQNNQDLKSTTETQPVFLPSPQYNPFGPDLPPLFPVSHDPPSAIPLDPIDQVKKPDVTMEPLYPGHQLIPMNSIYHGPMMPPGILPENGANHYLANYSHPPSIFRHIEQDRYKRPPLIGHYHIIRPIYAPFMPLRPINAPPPSSPSFYVSEYTPLHDSALTTTEKTTTMGANAKVWLQEIAPYTSAKRKKKKATEDRSRPHDIWTTVPTSPKMTEPRNYWSLIGGANTAETFNKDKYGYSHVAPPNFDVKPGSTQEDPPKTWTETTTGDVLYGKVKVQQPSTTEAIQQRHLYLMELLNEGYLMVFVLEIFRLIAVKDKREVQEVLAPMEPIYKTLSESGRLAWVGDPVRIFIEKLASVASSGGDSIDTIRTYSSIMFHSMLKREETLSPEVNSIINQAETLYSDDEGKRLLRSLTQFEDYPNTSKASYWICENLIENILQPLRRPAVLRSRERLLDSVNRALRRRFPLLMRERMRPKVGINPSEINRKYHRMKKRKRKMKPIGKLL